MLWAKAVGAGGMVGGLGPGVLHGARARGPPVHIPYLPLTPPLQQPAACCWDHTALATACAQPGPRKSLQFVAPCRPSAGLCRFLRRLGWGRGSPKVGLSEKRKESQRLSLFPWMQLGSLHDQRDASMVGAEPAEVKEKKKKISVPCVCLLGWVWLGCLERPGRSLQPSEERFPAPELPS